jgi:type II secretory pathway pseudopilin PulG
MLSHNEKGQGLIEMLVAISIILAAIVGGLSLMISSYNAGRQSLHRTVAANLGREAIEICKNLRNTAWINSQPFRDWFTNASLDYSAVPVYDDATGRWTLNFLPDDISDNGARVWIYTSGDLAGLMNNAEFFTPEETTYRRMIFFNPICYDEFGATEYTIGDGSDCDPDETIGVKITAQLSWVEQGKTSEIFIEDRLYNWRYR